MDNILFPRFDNSILPLSVSVAQGITESFTLVATFHQLVLTANPRECVCYLASFYRRKGQGSGLHWASMSAFCKTGTVPALQQSSSNWEPIQTSQTNWQTRNPNNSSGHQWLHSQLIPGAALTLLSDSILFNNTAVANTHSSSRKEV